MQEILIDVRELEHPEPLEKVMAAVNTLTLGEYIHMIHRKLPRPLLNILKNNGFAYQFTEEAEKVDVYICFKKDKETLKRLLDV